MASHASKFPVRGMAGRLREVDYRVRVAIKAHIRQVIDQKRRDIAGVWFMAFYNAPFDKWLVRVAQAVFGFNILVARKAKGALCIE